MYKYMYMYMYMYMSLRSQTRGISHSESEPEWPILDGFCSESDWESDSKWSFVPEIVLGPQRSPNGVLRMASATSSASSATLWRAPVK